jgi:hypothetical protein
MFRALGIPAIFFAMFLIVGGHWAVFQIVAWTGMVVEYSKTDSLGSAVAQTLSGEKPCTMCHSIQKEKQKEEQAPATLKSDKKGDNFLIRAFAKLSPPPASEYHYPAVRDEMAVLRNSAPPAPIPIPA